MIWLRLTLGRGQDRGRTRKGTTRGLNSLPPKRRARDLLAATGRGIAGAGTFVRGRLAERRRLAPLREANRAVSGAEKTLQDLEATLTRVKRESDGLLQRGADAHSAQVAALAFADGR